MADNTRLNPGQEGDLIRTEDVGPYKIAVSKIYLGAAGVDGGPVAPSNPLPVSMNVGGAAVGAANPLPVALGGGGPLTVSISMGGAELGAANPLPAALRLGGAELGAANPLPAALRLGGAAVGAANPLPVSLAGPGPLAVSQAGALPAGTNLIGGVLAVPVTGAIHAGTTALTPRFAAIAAGSAGANTLVEGVSGKRIRVLKYTALSGGAVEVKFRSGAGSELTGPMPLAAQGGVGAAYCPLGLFETAPGEPLVLELSVAAMVAGHLTYVEV